MDEFDKKMERLGAQIAAKREKERSEVWAEAKALWLGKGSEEKVKEMCRGDPYKYSLIMNEAVYFAERYSQGGTPFEEWQRNEATIRESQATHARHMSYKDRQEYYRTIRDVEGKDYLNKLLREVKKQRRQIAMSKGHGVEM